MSFQRVIGNYLDHLGAETKNGGEENAFLKVFPIVFHEPPMNLPLYSMNLPLFSLLLDIFAFSGDTKKKRGNKKTNMEEMRERRNDRARPPGPPKKTTFSKCITKCDCA